MIRHLDVEAGLGDQSLVHLNLAGQVLHVYELCQVSIKA